MNGKTWLGICLGMFVSAASALPAERPKGPDHFAITGARVVIGTGAVLDVGTVIIDGGLITTVSESANVPAGAWVIDGTGKTVYPGLVDALTDLGLSKDDDADESPPSFAKGPEDRPFTTSWRSAADELTLSDERIETWRQGGFTSSVTSPGDGIVSGQAAFINLAAERDRELVVLAPAALRVNLTTSGSSRRYPGSLMGVIAYVKQLFADATHYRESWAAYESAPRGRQRPSYDRALGPLSAVQTDAWPVLLPGHLEHEIERAVQLSKQMGVRPVVYGLHGGYAAAEFLASADVSVLVSVHWPERGKDVDPDRDELLHVLRLRDRAPTTPAALEQAGVEFAFYSDGLKSPDEIITRVRRAVDAGLSRERALEALTMGPASIFGLDDRLGSLTEGKIANVIVANGDLFDESTRVELVFVDGAKYEVTTSETDTATGGAE